MTPLGRRLRRPWSLGGKLIWILTLVGIVGATAIAAMLAAVIVPGFDRLEDRGTALRRQALAASVVQVAGRAAATAHGLAEGHGAPSGDIRLRVSPDRRVAPASPQDRGDTAVRAAAARWARSVDLDTALAGRRSAGVYAALPGGLAVIGIARDRRDDILLVVRPIGPDIFADTSLRDVAFRPDPVPATGGPSVAVAMPGVDRRPAAYAVLPLRGDLSRLGRHTLWAAVGGTVLLLAAMLLLLRRQVAHLVLRPLARIERHMHAVQMSGAVTLLDDDRRRDEIGSLVAALNAMLRRLHDMAGQLELRSFRLGRSESGAAVMHNVRNALSPISAILSHGLAQPPVAEREAVERAVAELARDDVPPDRRARLAGFVMAAIDAAARARADRLVQLETGRTALANVLEIIGRQHDVADTDLALAPCDATDLIARNGAIARFAGDGPSIACSFPAHPCWVRANRVILSQVIGNLFRNAAESIAARGGDSGQIIVTIARHDAVAVITIADDGEGFDPAAAPLLFQRGYSTRQARPGGLGLHWCANWVAAMGGTLRLDSEGPGRGARAVLTLPAVGDRNIA